jgi:methanogenic corrinoid protein MtbC1
LALIERLQVAREPLHAAVLDDYFTQHPPASEAERLRVTQRCREDLASHLDQLAAAFQLGEPRIFSDYLRWLQGVFASRCLAVAHVADALRVVHDWIAAQLAHDQAQGEVGALLAILQQGIATLTECDGTAHAGLPLVQPSATVQGLTQALLNGRRDTVEEQVLAALRDGAALVDVSVDLLQPALYQVGTLWQQNRISVAQEHLATAIAQTAMATGFGAADMAAPNGRLAAFGCVAGNMHSVGLRMVSDAFELAGWDVGFLGADVPNAALLAYCGEARPDMLGLSVSLPSQLPLLRALIDQLRGELGNAAPHVVVGGLLVNQLGAAARSLGADAWFRDAREAVQAASS